MSTSASGADRRLGVFPFVIGGLSYLPFIGIFFAIASIVWGLVTDKKGGKALALVGAGGIAAVFLVYGPLFRHYVEQPGGVFGSMRQELTQRTLNQLVQSIEFYKIAHGEYPPSLDNLKQENKNTMIIVYDATNIKAGSPPRYFYYQRVGADHYYLRSVGPDGEPFTSDDMVPQVDPDSAGKIGLLIDSPASK